MIHPKELFYTLDKSNTNIKKLRDAQKEFLDIYHEECKDKKRIGLKLPTGAGKSLIAILILESLRREGKKAGILCANNGLVFDMKNKIGELQIESVTILGAGRLSPEDLVERQKNVIKYATCNAIGIFNYHSFLYGYGSRYPFPLPDILIVDDASDFEIDRNDYGSIRINRFNSNHVNCYEAILDKLLEYENVYPNIIAFKNRESEHHTVELVLFPHQKEILDIIDKYKSELNEVSTFFFSYRRNSRFFYSSLILVSQYDIEIRPFAYHEENTPLKDISQIIFMSATLPKVDLLHKILGIDYEEIFMLDEKKLTKATYESIETMGCRLIFPLSQEYEYKGLSMANLESLKTLYNIHKKVLIMVNSFKESRQISNYFNNESIPYILYRHTDDGSEFANKRDKGCLICVNRFFGLDFPGDSCKIGVIAKLPLIWDSMDRFQISILNNYDYKEERLGNRLTQALGRCNRLEKDESIYYIFDSAMLSKIVDPSFHRYYPPNVFSEIMTGFVIAEGDIDKAIDYGESKFFNVDKNEYNAMLSVNKQLYNPLFQDEIEYDYNKEIIGWKLSTRSAYKDSGDTFLDLAEGCEKRINDDNRGSLELITAFYYYLSAFNYYNSYMQLKHLGSKELYKKSLKKSIELGRASSWFNKLSYIYNIEEHIKDRKIEVDEDKIKKLEIKEHISYEIDMYVETHTNKKHNWNEVLLEQLKKLNEGSHGEMLNSLEVFFVLLGFKTMRGKNQIGEPDLIILSMNTRPKYQLGIEVKSSKQNGEEGVSAVGESFVDVGKIQRDRTGYDTIPMVITQKTSFSDKAKISSYGRSKLISTEVFSYLLRKLYDRMLKYNDLPKFNQIYYRESFISPIELYNLFKPKGDAVITVENIEPL